MTQRTKVHFPSGKATCAAWHYPGTNGGCVVMASGTAVTKEPGTDRLPQESQEACWPGLASDSRRFGESGGEPRQIVRIGEQQADFEAAIAFARTLPGVEQIAIWGFSLAGGHVLPVAARHPELAGAIAQSPLADALAAARNAAKHQTPLAMLRLTIRALLDAIGGVIGRDPLLVPLVGAPGTVASLTTPDAQDGNRALNPGNRYPDWRQEVAARSALLIGLYRPGRFASRVDCPLLVVACDDDQSALAAPAARAAEHARRGQLVSLPGGHYAPFLDGHERVVEAELAFLHRHLASSAAAGRRQAA